MLDKDADNSELRAIEACLGDRVAFSLPETAKISAGRSDGRGRKPPMAN